MLFPELDRNSKIWVYSSSRKLTEEEVSSIQKDINIFTSEWTAHGTNLLAKGIVIENRFIVLCVDESMSGASGCSIDSSIRFVKTLGENYDINLFDRMYFYTLDSQDKIHFNDVSNSSRIFYNPLVRNLGEFDLKWIIEGTKIQ